MRSEEFSIHLKKKAIIMIKSNYIYSFGGLDETEMRFYLKEIF